MRLRLSAASLDRGAFDENLGASPRCIAILLCSLTTSTAFGGSLLGGVGGTVGGVVGGVGGAVGGVGGAVGGALGEVGGAVGGALGGVGSSVGGALGGASSALGGAASTAGGILPPKNGVAPDPFTTGDSFFSGGLRQSPDKGIADTSVAKGSVPAPAARLQPQRQKIARTTPAQSTTAKLATLSAAATSRNYPSLPGMIPLTPTGGYGVNNLATAADTAVGQTTTRVNEVLAGAAGGGTDRVNRAGAETATAVNGTTGQVATIANNAIGNVSNAAGNAVTTDR